MDSSVIIVSYNTADLTLACLDSLWAALGEKEIFVIDNASTDGSADAVRRRFPSITLTVNSENRGFGAACNQALNLCRGRYVVFLNPDATVKENTLERAVSFMDTHLGIGMAGARMLNPDGTPQESVSYRYPGEKYAQGETAALPGDIACVLGAFMITRKSLLDELGGFDEDFFLYGEDQDLAWRIREKGFSIGYMEEADVFHWGAQSEVQTPPVDVFAKKIRATYLFYAKHYGPQTIRRIKQAERIKAIYRLFTLKLTAPFVRDKAAHENKTRCYQIALDMAKL